MIYQTRHMIALQGMRYMGRELTAGEQFEPTEVDATYFEQHGIAGPAPAPAPAPVAEAPRRGRPPKAAAAQVETPPPPAESVIVEAAETQPLAESFALGAADLA